MIIKHTYDVAEECGNWHVTRDGEPIRNYVYRAPNLAREAAEKLTTSNNLWCGIFEIEYPVAKALKDATWPYGATCVNEGTDDDPKWILTEPYRAEGKSSRPVNPDPTGYVQISVYDRDLYAEACMIVGVAPATDDDIADEFCDCTHGHLIPDDISPLEAVKIRLAFRRASGILVERMIEQNSHADRLEEAGLMLDEFTRDEYTRACEIMEVTTLTDRQVMMVVTLNIMGEIGVQAMVSGIPNDPVSTALAFRRSLGITREQNADADADTSANADGEENTGDDVPDTTT